MKLMAFCVVIFIFLEISYMDKFPEKGWGATQERCDKFVQKNRQCPSVRVRTDSWVPLPLTFDYGQIL